jgi:phage tail sheath protein FI
VLNADVDERKITGDKAQLLKAEIAKVAALPDPANTNAATYLNQQLLVNCPAFKTILTSMLKKLNVMPPSPAIAGIYTMTDNNRGVWKAPANISLNAVVAPTVNLSHADQEDLNVPLDGKAVNAIRSFVGEGVMVWGARTLDSNSPDWRYVSVRRTAIYLEQSIKAAAMGFVFAPNTANTWITIKSMIDNFLTDVWKQGGLAGAVPADAFSVDVGLGTTMTAMDVLDGLMRISVKVAISRPAEFIVITVEQQMQKS